MTAQWTSHQSPTNQGQQRRLRAEPLDCSTVLSHAPIPLQPVRSLRPLSDRDLDRWKRASPTKTMSGDSSTHQGRRQRRRLSLTKNLSRPLCVATSISLGSHLSGRTNLTTSPCRIGSGFGNHRGETLRSLKGRRTPSSSRLGTRGTRVGSSSAYHRMTSLGARFTGYGWARVRPLGGASRFNSFLTGSHHRAL